MEVSSFHGFKPRNWWGEVKQLCGSAKSSSGLDLTPILHSDLVCDDPTLADKINQAFASVMVGYSPLTESVCVGTNGDQPITVTEISVQRKLCEISCAHAGGPDDLPNWVLREFADILAATVADILNSSFSECKIPRAWKIADVLPLPKAPTVNDINKDLRPISLTSTLSKVAESFVIDEDLKPALLLAVDPSQFGFIQGSCTTFALISMFHHWMQATDSTGSTVGTALLDFRKAFDLVDHHILFGKLLTLGIKPTVVNWVIDFLRNRQLKHAGITPSHLVLFFCSVIRSVLEYACQVFHCNLPLYLWDEIERIQRHALRIIFPACNYSQGLVKAGLPSLYDRRSQ